MTAAIVADAGPLIGLGKIGRLPLLQTLYGMVLIPQGVHEELRVGSNLPGAVAAERGDRRRLAACAKRAGRGGG